MSYPKDPPRPALAKGGYPRGANRDAGVKEALGLSTASTVYRRKAQSVDIAPLPPGKIPMKNRHRFPRKNRHFPR
jgi:hypothetical protein